MADFPNKLLKLLNGFDDKAPSMSTDDLKKELLSAERAINSFQKDLDNDTKLLVAKEEVKELSSVYKESIREYSAKVKYIVYVLDERGAP